MIDELQNHLYLKSPFIKLGETEEEEVSSPSVAHAQGKKKSM